MMRKALFLFILLLAGLGVYAQDIIVKADGSTVLAKVLNVTPTEVQYKKATNPDGPTYTISVSELISINYENGEKDTFSNMATPSEPVVSPSSASNPDILTNETATQFSDDSKLLSIYQKNNKAQEVKSLRRKGKIWKIAGITLGVVGIGLGIYSIADKDNLPFDNAPDEARLTGGILIGLGVVVGTTGYLVGNYYCKKANELDHGIASAPIMETEFNFPGGSNLRLGVDIMTCHLPNTRDFNPGVGVGLRYSF